MKGTSRAIHAEGLLRRASALLEGVARFGVAALVLTTMLMAAGLTSPARAETPPPTADPVADEHRSASVDATRALLATPPDATLRLGSAWVPQGPGYSTDGQLENVPDGNPVCGAVHSLATHPTNADIIYVGAVNGGVWVTVNATGAAPSWTPLTDDFPSLCIGDIEFDPIDATHRTLVAGTGSFSNFGRRGTTPTGILRTTNGGNSWSHLGQDEFTGQDIWGVAPRGVTILVGSDWGVYRSTDQGATFPLISGTTGINVGPGYCLAGDPGNNARVYAAVGGGAGGVFRTDDMGATWTDVTDAAIAALVSNATSNMEMAVSAAPGNAVFLAIVNGGVLAGVFRSDDQGGTWTAMDLPQTMEAGVPQGIHPGGQGTTNTSIAADPANGNIVYLGGDVQPGPLPNSIGANGWVGRLFRGDAGIAPTGGVPSPQWTPITHVGTLNNSAPHADSRDMDFDVLGQLVEGDDGGIYRQTAPATGVGVWISVFTGGLQIAEFHDVAYDANFNVVVGGTQDTGTPYQLLPGSFLWNELDRADGGDVAVDASTPGQSIFYWSTQNLGGFSRRTCTGPGVCGATVGVGLNTVSGTALVPGTGGNCQFVTPIELNTQDPTRMIIGGLNSVYESADQGDNIAELNSPGPNRNAMVYGHPSNADLIVIGSFNQVFVRTVAGAALTVTGTDPPGIGTVTDVAVDPANVNVMFAVGGGIVAHTWDGGATWTDITGNLDTMSGGGLRSVVLVEGTLTDVLVVGAEQGVFACLEPFPGCWFELGEGLPNTIGYDLVYDPGNDILTVGLLGRGAWTLGGVGNLVAPAVVTSPNGGETLVAGCQIEVTWEVGAGFEDEELNILYSDDGGLTWTPILTNTANDGSDLVTLPCEETDQGRIAVELAWGSFCDSSNENFEVVFPTITVNAFVDNDFDPPDPWVQNGLVIDDFEISSDVDLFNIHFVADPLQDPGVPCEVNHTKSISGDLVEFVPEVISHLPAGQTVDIEVKFTVPVGQHTGNYEGLIHVLANPLCGCPVTLTEEFEAALDVEPLVDVDVDDNEGSLSNNVLYLRGAKGDEPSGGFVVINPNSEVKNVDPADGPGNIRIDLVDVDLEDLVKIGDPDVAIPAGNITLTGDMASLASGEAADMSISVLIPDDVPINALYEGIATVNFEGCLGGAPVSDSFTIQVEVRRTQGPLEILEDSLAGEFCPPDDPWTAIGEVVLTFDVYADGDHRNVRVSCGGLGHDTLDETLTDFSFYPEEIAFMAAGETRTVTVVVYIPIGQHSGTYTGEFVVVSENEGEATVPVTIEICEVYDLDIRDDYGHLGDDVMLIEAMARANQSGGEWVMRAFDIGLPNDTVGNHDASDGPGNTPVECLTYEFDEWSSLWQTDDQGHNYHANKHFTGVGSVVGELCDWRAGEYRRLLVALFVPRMHGNDNHPGTYKGRLDCWANVADAEVGHDYFDIEVHLARIVGTGPSHFDDATFGGYPDEGGARLYWGSFEEIGLTGSVNLYREDPAVGTYVRLNGAPMAQSSDYLDTDVEPGVEYNYRIGVDFEGTEFSIGPVPVGGIPGVHKLSQNAPNPFRDRTSISFQLPASSRVSLRIYDVSGRLVRTLRDGEEPAGYHAVSWDRRDESGREVASGVYFCRLEADEFSETKKMMVLR